MDDKTLLVIDLDRCWGCGTCEVACALEKKSGPGSGRVKVEEAREGSALPLPGSPQGRAFVPVLCQQCDDPACVSSCPAGALVKNASGIVELEADLCIACGACESACPFGAITMGEASGMPEKCDLCASRRSAGLLPACVQHCPGKALALGPSLPGIDQARGLKRSWSSGKVEYRARS